LHPCDPGSDIIILFGELLDTVIALTGVFARVDKLVGEPLNFHSMLVKILSKIVHSVSKMSGKIGNPIVAAQATWCQREWI
jgi:hypothetical protein